MGHCDPPQRAFGGVVAQANPPIVEEPGERRPAFQHVIHRAAEVVVAGHASPLAAHPGLQLVHQRPDVFGAGGQALLRRSAVDVPLEIEDGVDPTHRLERDRYLGHVGQHVELAPAVRPARRLGDRAGFSPGVIEIVEPGIGIGLQDAGIVGQVLARMLATTVARVVEQGRRWRRTAERPVIAHVGPKPARDGLAAGQHRHGGVVAMDPRGTQHVGSYQRHQRRQCGRAGADPVRHGGDVEVDVLAGVGLALPVQRQASRAGEFHPHALPEPYVSLSAHTAPSVRPAACRSCQWANRPGDVRITRASQSRAPFDLCRSGLNLRRAHLTRKASIRRSVGYSADL